MERVSRVLAAAWSFRLFSHHSSVRLPPIRPQILRPFPHHSHPEPTFHRSGSHHPHTSLQTLPSPQLMPHLQPAFNPRHQHPHTPANPSLTPTSTSTCQPVLWASGLDHSNPPPCLHFTLFPPHLTAGQSPHPHPPGLPSPTPASRP